MSAGAARAIEESLAKVFSRAMRIAAVSKQDDRLARSRDANQTQIEEGVADSCEVATSKSQNATEAKRDAPLTCPKTGNANEQSEDECPEIDIIKLIEEGSPTPSAIGATRITPRRPRTGLPANLYSEKERIGRAGDFAFHELIGEGNFTQIFRATERITGNAIAVKVASKAKLLRLHKVDDLKVEKHCLERLRGVKGVVQLRETFQDSDNLYIAMELLCGRELLELCNVFGIAIREKAIYIFFQLLETVNEIHKKGIAHRDLKPENVIVGEDGRVTLFDFGSAKDEDKGVQSRGNTTSGRRFFRDFVGTPEYMAPECRHNIASSTASDVYSLGCLYYKLLFGFSPFIGRSDYLVFKAAEEFQLCFHKSVFSEFDRQIIVSCLQSDPKARPTLAELVERFSPFVVSDWANAAPSDSWRVALERFVERLKGEKRSEGGDVNAKIDMLRAELSQSRDFESEFEVVEERLTIFRRQILHFLAIEEFKH